MQTIDGIKNAHDFGLELATKTVKTYGVGTLPIIIRILRSLSGRFAEFEAPTDNEDTTTFLALFYSTIPEVVSDLYEHGMLELGGDCVSHSFYLVRKWNFSSMIACLQKENYLPDNADKLSFFLVKPVPRAGETSTSATRVSKFIHVACGTFCPQPDGSPPKAIVIDESRQILSPLIYPYRPCTQGVRYGDEFFWSLSEPHPDGSVRISDSSDLSSYHYQPGGSVENNRLYSLYLDAFIESLQKDSAAITFYNEECTRVFQVEVAFSTKIVSHFLFSGNGKKKMKPKRGTFPELRLGETPRETIIEVIGDRFTSLGFEQAAIDVGKLFSEEFCQNFESCLLFIGKCKQIKLR